MKDRDTFTVLCIAAALSGFMFYMGMLDGMHRKQCQYTDSHLKIIREIEIKKAEIELEELRNK